MCVRVESRLAVSLGRHLGSDWGLGELGTSEVELGHLLKVRERRLRERRAVHRSGSIGEPGACHDAGPQLGDGDPLHGIRLKDLLEDGVQTGRQGEDGSQELAILEVGPVRAVGLGGTLPRIAATGEVDQDHTEGPDIIGCGSVAIRSSGRGLLAL